jgi:hypothetical protein
MVPRSLSLVFFTNISYNIFVQVVQVTPAKLFGLEALII